jgi:hypothetical protein
MNTTVSRANKHSEGRCKRRIGIHLTRRLAKNRGSIKIHQMMLKVEICAAKYSLRGKLRRTKLETYTTPTTGIKRAMIEKRKVSRRHENPPHGYILTLQFTYPYPIPPYSTPFPRLICAPGTRVLGQSSTEIGVRNTASRFEGSL